jgi:hypothetical protein
MLRHMSRLTAEGTCNCDPPDNARIVPPTERVRGPRAARRPTRVLEAPSRRA